MGHAREDFQKREDEFDYAKPLEGQAPLPMEDHWRKHTLSWTMDDGATPLQYRPVIYHTVEFLLGCSGAHLTTALAAFFHPQQNPKSRICYFPAFSMEPRDHNLVPSHGFKS